MTKTAVISVLLALSLLSATSISALDSTPSTTIKRPLLPNIQQKIDTRKEITQTKMEDIKAKMASREAQLKLKLNTFKDKKKATAAARINTNLNTINANQTTMMQKNLDVFTAILNKLENRVNAAKPDIKDPAAAKTAIAAARHAISSASSAITAQAGKDYTIQVTSETKVRLDALSQREQLFKDISALRKIVIDAKQAVVNAIRTAKAENTQNKEATKSGK